MRKLAVAGPVPYAKPTGKRGVAARVTFIAHDQQITAANSAGKIVLRAAQAKSADKVFESGEAVNESCDNCHQKYKRGS